MDLKRLINTVIGYLLKSPFAQRQQGFLVESLQILHLAAD